MERREVSKIKYFIVFIITTLVFLVGIWVGQLIADMRFGKIDEAQTDLRTQTATLETQYLLITQNPCILLESDKLGEELYQMGTKLSHMEQSYGKNSKDVKNLKEYYSLLELRHWLFLEQIKTKCRENNFTTILFFYSNLDDCGDCDEQGYVLTYLKEKYPELKIYSFDINIDNPALEWVKDLYDIEKVPTLIINGKKYTGLMDEDKVKGFIR